jgi:predicted metal-binding protein
VGAEIVVCSTCRFAADDRDDPAGVRGGKRLYEALRLAAQAPRFAGLQVSQVECLWACSQHCTIHLRAPGKCSYVAGRFAPDGREAAAILDFALAYAESPDGSVPYRLWPEDVKGHFITRSPASRTGDERMS